MDSSKHRGRQKRPRVPAESRKRVPRAEGERVRCMEILLRRYMPGISLDLVSLKGMIETTHRPSDVFEVSPGHKCRIKQKVPEKGACMIMNLPGTTTRE